MLRTRRIGGRSSCMRSSGTSSAMRYARPPSGSCIARIRARATPCSMMSWRPSERRPCWTIRPTHTTGRSAGAPEYSVRHASPAKVAMAMGAACSKSPAAELPSASSTICR